MALTVEKLVQLYEGGVITHYEMFNRAREMKLILPEEYQEEYQKWNKEHPEGKCITFSIFA